MAKLGIVTGGMVTATNLADLLETVADKLSILPELTDTQKSAIKDSLTTIYGIKEEKEAYTSIGAQCAEIASRINNAKNINVSNLNSDTLIELAKTMQDSDKIIDLASMKFLERVVSARDIDIKELISVIKLLKNDVGSMDANKCALFLSLYLLPDSSIESVVGTLSKHYGFEIPEELKQTAKTKNSATANQVTNNKTTKQINSIYTIEEALKHLQSVGVECRIEKGGIVIEGDYDGNPKRKYSHSASLKNSNLDEQAILKYVVEIKGFADFENSKVTDLSSLISIGGYADFSNSQVTDLSSLVSIDGCTWLGCSQIKDLDRIRSIIKGLVIE